jgi:hypothetical protein
MDEDLPDPTKIYFWECLLGGFLITVWQISCIVIAAISGDEGIAYLSMMLYFPMFFFVTSGVISSLGYGGTSKLVHGVLTTIIGLTFFTLIHILYIADSSGTSEIIHPSINFIMSCMVGGVLGSVLHIIVA